MYSDSVPLIPKDPSSPLRVIMIGRISTDHQNIENIDASYADDERYLHRIYKGEMYIKRLGERGSGWKINRATIKEALDEIRTCTWDIVIMEELGRAYRNPEFQYMIAHLCVDHQTRLICIGDAIDTGVPNWEAMLSAAVMRHGMTVPETRRRVRRTATYQFHQGGMVLKIRYGYRRLTPEEAASGSYGPKNLRLAKVVEATLIILEMRIRVLRGDSYNEIADWLNDSGILPGEYVTSGKWTGRLVADLLWDPILHGLRTFRDVEHTMIFSTGEHRRDKNENPETELIPELAHMTREEQEELWVAMQLRRTRRKTPNSRNGVPRRSSLWPGQHLRCEVCGDEVYWVSPSQLKCRNAYSGRLRTCWNQVLIDAKQVRIKLLPLLLQRIRGNSELLNLFIDAAWNEFQQQGKRFNHRSKDLEQRLRERQKDCESIATLLIKRPDSEILLQRMDEAETEIRKLQNELSEEREACRSNVMCQNRVEVEAHFEAVVLHLSRTSFGFTRLMQRTFSDFKVVPVQALDTPQVHPRIKLTLPGDCNSNSEKEQIVIDAFDAPQHILHLQKYLNAREEHQNLSVKKIAQLIEVPGMTVRRSSNYARLMTARGTTELFVELTERPTKASRWREQSLAPPPPSDKPVRDGEE